jgi:N-acylneuraminate-9-phosphatase
MLRAQALVFSPAAVRCLADLDDTLIATAQADAEAYEEVVALLTGLHPGLDAARLIAEWRALFAASPWDADHKARSRPRRAAPSVRACSCSPTAHPRGGPPRAFRPPGRRASPALASASAARGAGGGPPHSAHFAALFRFCCLKPLAVESLLGRTPHSSADACSTWPPQVEVEAWRAALWARALRAQGAAAAAAEALGAQAQARFTAARMRRLRFMEGVLELIAGLKGQGYAVVLITNGHHAVQRAKLAACAAHGAFDPGMIVVGGEEELAGRHQKPHPGIFLRACTLAGCAPGEAAMVGDSLAADVGGGAAAGLAATVWVNPGGGAAPAGGPQPTASVRSVLELPAVLRALQGAP